jgi:type II secretory pathway pseudopilin PulG
MKNIKQKGQVLIEALVALGVAVVIIGVVVIVVINSLNNVELAKNENLATQYAKEGIEVVKELSETNWNALAVNGEDDQELSSQRLIDTNSRNSRRPV